VTRPAGPDGLRRFVPGAPGPAPQTTPGPAPLTQPGPAAAVQDDRRTGAERPGGPPVGGRAGGPGAELVGGGAGVSRQAMEKCELCSEEIPAEHGHVADLDHSSLLCACRACYLLFTHSQAGRGRYRAVPDRYLEDPDRPMTAAEWGELEIPVGLAFFLHSSDAGEVTAFYPSPAGATECRLDLAAWDRLAAAHPLLGAIAPDVEAILICRTDDSVEHYLVPIDACYELAGRMRLHWRGFDGGAEARQSIADFLGQVRSQARPLSKES
jgi:Family of unknown function (DUF5947)